MRLGRGQSVGAYSVRREIYDQKGATLLHPYHVTAVTSSPVQLLQLSRQVLTRKLHHSIIEGLVRYCAKVEQVQGIRKCMCACCVVELLLCGQSFALQWQ